MSGLFLGVKVNCISSVKQTQRTRCGLLKRLCWIVLSISIFSWISTPYSFALVSSPTNTLRVTVTGTSSLIGAFAITIEYDHRAVTFDRVTATGSAQGSLVLPNVNPEKGWVKIGLINASGFSPGEVMDITFRVSGLDLPSLTGFTVRAITVTDITGKALTGARVKLFLEND